MRTTIAPTAPAFESISLAALTAVQGGCGKKHGRPCSPPPQQAAPEPAPQAQAIAPSAPLVSTNVSVTGY
jgi:hypothetical protein